jgi:putative membrane protein
VRYVGAALAVAGFGLAILLFLQEDIAGIVDMLRAAGPGLVLASLVHVAPMMLNARAWQRLLPDPGRASLRVMTGATWVRESVNGLLPVGRIGGEIVAYRMLRRNAIRAADAAAGLVADMALSVLSQAAFTLLGLGFLLLLGRAAATTTQFAAAVAAMMSLGIAFCVAQRAGALSAVVRMLNRLLAGRLQAAIVKSLRLDDAIRDIYERRSDVAACFGWQLAGWIVGAVEIWLALYFLGQPRSVIDAIVIEALIQAIGSAAFVVPAALGVQEGGFLLVGGALGIDATTALALASARRLRDVIVFFPGLVAWQWAEARARNSRARAVSESP